MAKWRLAVTGQDAALADLVRSSDHRLAAVWAADCAERVLPYFEDKYPTDARPRAALAACRAWARTGIFRMSDVRRASLDAHAAARAAPEHSPARSAARAAGQAMATAHVAAHAIAAAIYAATAVRDAAAPADAAVAVIQERAWQIQHLLDLRAASK